MVLRVTVGKSVLNLVSVYAPQVGRTTEEKEEFFTSLSGALVGMDARERLVVCGDMNGHVGSRSDGFEDVHGGNGFGIRNVEGEMLLEFACAMELVVANTWFKKEDSKKVTYDSGGCRTVVDYVLVRKSDRAMVKNVKVIGSEACILQHKLVVSEVELKEHVKKSQVTFVRKPRVWRLKEAEMQKIFREKVQNREAERDEGDVESTWNGQKDCLLGVAEEVCGKTKGLPRHKETWWWNDEVAKVIQEKRRLYKMWSKSRTVEDQEAYRQAKVSAKRVIFKAQEAERKKFGDLLDDEDEKGHVFRVAKQMVRKNRDVVGGGCVKDRDGKIVVEEEKIKEVWRDYFEKLLNEEFDWNKNSLEPVNAVSGPEERISTNEVRAAIAKMKIGKAAGPSGVVAEMVKAAGEAGILWVTDVCNAIVKEGRIPVDWRKSWMVNVYKGKGDALECGSYRGIKLLDHVMKVFERVIERRVRNRVKIDDMQFGFRPGRGTTDAIFVVRQIQEKFLAKKKELWMAFVDLEKAFDRVPREVLWWALRRSGVEEWIVNNIKVMYEGSTTAIKLNDGESKEFEVKVGVHQGSVLSPLLFIIVLEALSKEFREGLPWELLYADDLALIAKSEEKLVEKIKCWKKGMEEKGLRVNMGKTKVMRCKIRFGQLENSGKWPCGICRKGVGSNSICCSKCKKWIHKKCSLVSGRLQDVVGFQCARCVRGDSDKADEVKELLLGEEGKLEYVDRFCYLGDMVGNGGGAEESSRTRVRCAWGKFRELLPILTLRGASLKLKGKIYRACVQRVMVYGSETWSMKVDDMRRLDRAESMMVRWMCGVTLKDRKSNEELLGRLGIECVFDVVRRGRLRWFGHVERKNKDDWVAACRDMVVEGEKRRGRGRKTWHECVLEDMRKLKLRKEDAQNRVTWRRGIYGEPSNLR